MRARFEPYDPSVLKYHLQLRGFKVSRVTVPQGQTTSFGRRHYFMIILSLGSSRVYYGDRDIEMDGAYLFFANPEIPYATEIISESHTGYSCVFTEDFIRPVADLESMQQSPLFNLDEPPAFKLDTRQQSVISGIFDTMITKESSDYSYKDDLMRSYIQLLVHMALQMRPTEHYSQYHNAPLRLATRFLEVLESQFPVENPNDPLRLRSAGDFADRLAVHINYLNRSVKKITGKSTTALISNRIAVEAVSLLRLTDWSVGEIAYALGFEYPNYFSNFIKKATGSTASEIRSRKV